VSEPSWILPIESWVALYEMITDTPAGTQLICEWYGLDGDRIA
jgi:hypothetical protein